MYNYRRTLISFNTFEDITYDGYKPYKVKRRTYDQIKYQRSKYGDTCLTFNTCKLCLLYRRKCLSTTMHTSYCDISLYYKWRDWFVAAI